MVLIVLNHAIHMSLEIPAELGYTLVSGWPRFILTLLQAFGVFAVPIFLFISGAFIAYAARGKTGLSLNFLRSSLQHILLPYLFWSIIFYAIVYFQYRETFTPLGYVKNLITGYPFHFVPLLILFYVASPLLIALARRYGFILLLAIGLYQLALLGIRDPAIFPLRFPSAARFLFPPVIGNTFADWGIFFPMGLVFSLHAARLKPHLQRWQWVFLGATIVIFIAGLLHTQSILYAPWARFICPFTFLFVLPLISRRAIPWVSQLEQVGKRSYGLYLTHLIVIDLLLLLVRFTVPSLLQFQWVLVPILLAAGLALPLYAMSAIARQSTGRKVYRYVFG